jgi:hypothetical protein
MSRRRLPAKFSAFLKPAPCRECARGIRFESQHYFGTIMAYRSAHLSKKFQQGIRLSFDRALFDGSAVPPQISCSSKGARSSTG